MDEWDLRAIQMAEEKRQRERDADAWDLRAKQMDEEKRLRAQEAEIYKQRKEISRLFSEMNAFYAERKKEKLRRKGICGECLRPLPSKFFETLK